MVQNYELQNLANIINEMNPLLPEALIFEY